MKKSNKNLLPMISKVTELEEVTSEQLLEVTQFISNNINLNKLKESVTKACKILSGVGGPSFMADAKELALDNQKRLELVYMLLDTYERIEADVKNFRKNRLDCRDNDEYLSSFILNTQKLLLTIKDYEIFRIEEQKENMSYLDEHKKKMLNE